MPTVSTVPTHADSRSDFPVGDLRSDGFQPSHDFVSRHARILNARVQTRHSEHVAVTDTAGLHFDTHLPRPRRRDLALDKLKRAVGLLDLNHLHSSHFGSPWDAWREPTILRPNRPAGS